EESMSSMSVGCAKASIRTDSTTSNAATVERTRYRVARPEVAEQLMEGELVIINFANGKYHGVRGSGVQIWAWLDQGYSADEIVVALNTAADGSAPARRLQILEFIAELERQGLMVRAHDVSAPRLRLAHAFSVFAAPEIDTLED